MKQPHKQYRIKRSEFSTRQNKNNYTDLLNDKNEKFFIPRTNSHV